MKKISLYVASIVVLLLAVCAIFFNFNDKKEDKKEELKKITVAEVAHTIFYAPQYVAIEKGYFKDEGIDLNLTLTPGADKVTAAVLAGDADIGFSGSVATV